MAATIRNFPVPLWPKTSRLTPRRSRREAGAAYELVLVDLAGGQQRTGDYLAINPKGRVPVPG
jgi:glutathione S-transferase